MNAKEHELKSLLTCQQFEASAQSHLLIDKAKLQASCFASSTEGIAVVSDFRNNQCHIFAGRFGQRVLGLSEYEVNMDSAFEDSVFSMADKEELLERHILELRFFNFIKDVPTPQKTDYQASCLMRFAGRASGRPTDILHTTRYLNCDINGNVIVGFCTFVPFPQVNGKYNNAMVNIATGEVVGPEQYGKSDRNILSKRQLEILRLLAQGVSSKQIAARLNISLFTVNRHRQDILSALKVANTAAAVEIGLRMNLI